MNNTARTQGNNDITGVAIARIDAQDVSYVLPIREFLESRGVVVFVNSISEGQATYHIISGDTPFVADIISRNTSRGEKQLRIVIDGDPNEETIKHGTGKVIFVDSEPLTPGDVTNIFEFFFTSSSDDLNLQKHPRLPLPERSPATHNEALRAGRDGGQANEFHPKEDGTRIKAIIADVYNQKPRSKKFKNQRRWLTGLLIVVGCLVVPVIWYVMSITFAGISLYMSARSFTNGAISSSRRYNGVAQYWISQGRMILSVASVSGQTRAQERLVSFLTHTSSAIGEALIIADLGDRVAKNLVSQVDVSATGMFPATDIRSIRSALIATQNTLGLAQAELTVLLQDKTFPLSLHYVSGLGDRSRESLIDMRRSLSDMDKLLMLFSQLAGFKEPRTYLILLQNSFELRPTGGFIGSIALASLTDGRLTSLTIEDVYTVDGQLKGHVDPPQPLKELLGVEHWYLRDSNWDPEFEKAASRAMWFYEKETGKVVDGVIAINTSFITEVLRVVGPLALTDYSDTISADNFYGKAIYYTQQNFFPGSTQKKDFLGTLLTTLISTITSSPKVSQTQLFRALTTSLYQHDIMLMFTDDHLQSLVTHFGWAGSIPGNVGCHGTNPKTCESTPLVLNEANLGVNKVNYLVTRAIGRLITFKPDGTRSEKITMTIKNASGREEQSPYRVYLRYMQPPLSSVTGVTLDGVVIPSTKSANVKIPPYVESAGEIAGNATLGVAIDVPPSGESNIEISVDVPKPIIFDIEGSRFDVMVQKQPGVDATPVTTTIAYPPEWTAGIEILDAVGEARDLIAKSGQLTYNTILTSDTLTRIRFTK